MTFWQGLAWQILCKQKPFRSDQGRLFFTLVPGTMCPRRLQRIGCTAERKAELRPALHRAVKASGGAFKLRDRALHVYSEAARVPQFRDACNAEAGADDTLRRLGDLMNASHASCRCGPDLPLNAGTQS